MPGRHPAAAELVRLDWQQTETALERIIALWKFRCALALCFGAVSFVLMTPFERKRR
jgi:hypothetical protein